MKKLALLLSILVLTACGDLATDPGHSFCEGKANKVATVTVAPRTVTMQQGDTIPLYSNVLNRYGKWNLCMPDPTWTSSDSTIVWARSGFLFLQSAIAIGMRPGTVYLKATAQGQADSMLVTVRN